MYGVLYYFLTIEWYAAIQPGHGTVPLSQRCLGISITGISTVGFVDFVDFVNYRFDKPGATTIDRNEISCGILLKVWL